LPMSIEVSAFSLTYQARYVRVEVPRRAIHASCDSPCHLSAKRTPLGYLPSPHVAFQEHAPHTAGWSAVLSSNGSRGTCIPRGLTTFLQGAFTAHLIDFIEQGGDKLHGDHTALLASQGCHASQRGRGVGGVQAQKLVLLVCKVLHII